MTNLDLIRFNYDYLIMIIQSINESIKNLSEQMQKHCSHCTSIWEKWGDITCLEMTVKKGKF